MLLDKHSINKIYSTYYVTTNRVKVELAGQSYCMVLLADDTRHSVTEGTVYCGSLAELRQQ